MTTSAQCQRSVIAGVEKPKGLGRNHQIQKDILSPFLNRGQFAKFNLAIAELVLRTAKSESRYMGDAHADLWAELDAIGYVGSA